MKTSNLIPDCIRNDPATIADMESLNARNASYGGGRHVFFEPTDSSWADKIEAARWMDAYARANHGQRTFDADFHLCHEQQYQQRDGFRIYEIGSWIGGGAVRDTHNDGDGTVFGGRYKPGATFGECLEWAREWHAEKPTHRKVILGFWWHAFFKRQMTLDELLENPEFTGKRIDA